MTKTIASIVSSALLLSGAAITVASALDVSAGADVRVGATSGSRGQGDEHRNDNAQVGASSTARVEHDDGDERGNATSSAARDRHDDDDDDDNDHATSSRGTITSAEHRSQAASFVKSLLDVADRENGGIGEEVRIVARAQNDSASTTADAIAHVEGRNAIMVFLIGSDYKNLGKIRGEAVTTQNSINRLMKVADKTTDATAKAEIEAQVKVIEDSQVKLDAFVQAHESAFSLFGWFFKLFGSN